MKTLLDEIKVLLEFQLKAQPKLTFLKEMITGAKGRGNKKWTNDEDDIVPGFVVLDCRTKLLYQNRSWLKRILLSTILSLSKFYQIVRIPNPVFPKFMTIEIAIPIGQITQSVKNIMEDVVNEQSKEIKVILTGESLLNGLNKKGLSKIAV